MINKNTETDTGLNVKNRKANCPATREFLPFWTLQTGKERVPVSSHLNLNFYYLCSYSASENIFLNNPVQELSPWGNDFFLKFSFSNRKFRQ